MLHSRVFFFGTSEQQRHPGRETRVTALTKSWQDNEKTQRLKNTEMWYMWFMGDIMAVSGLLVEEGEQAVSHHFGRQKKPLSDCDSVYCRVFLSACDFSPLCLSSSLSFWLNMFCWDASSHHPPSLPLPFIPLPSPAAFYSISQHCEQVFFFSDFWTYGSFWKPFSLFCVYSSCKPFLTSHLHMQRQQMSLNAFLNINFVTRKEGFVLPTRSFWEIH